MDRRVWMASITSISCPLWSCRPRCWCGAMALLLTYADKMRVASDARCSLPLEALPLHQRLGRRSPAEQIARYGGAVKAVRVILAR